MNSQSRAAMREATTRALLIASASFMALMLAVVHFTKA